MLSRPQNQVFNLEQAKAALIPPGADFYMIGGWQEYQRKMLWDTQDSARFLLGELEKTEKSLAEKTDLLSSLTTEVELRQQLRDTHGQLEVAQHQLEDEYETNARLMGEISRYQLQHSQSVSSQTDPDLEAAVAKPQLDLLGRPPHPSLVGGDIFC